MPKNKVDSCHNNHFRICAKIVYNFQMKGYQYYDNFNLNVQFDRFLAYLLFSYISKFFQLSNSKYYPTYINCGISVAFYRPDLRPYDVKNIKGLPLTLNFNSNFLMAHFPWQDFVQQHRHFKSLFLMQSQVYLR